MADRLQAAREAFGFSSARSAAQAFGWKESTYGAHENGQNGFNPETARKYARAFNVSAAWLLTGEGRGPARLPGVRYVRVLGDVQAGVWRESNEWPADDQFGIAIPDEPELERARLFALEVRGNSMDRIYPAGTIVVCVAAVSQRQLVAGKRYVVERIRADGHRETTLKTVSADQDGRLWLVPESNDPRFSAALPVRGEEGETIRVIGRVCYSVRPE